MLYLGIRLRGLPFNVKTVDIQNFFNGYEIHDEVKIGKNSDGSKTGEGAVLFKNEDDCKRAF